MDKEQLQKIFQIMFDQWRAENPQMFEDINKLCADVVRFNTLYGTNFMIVPSDNK